jgi:hypothetical protein
MNIDACFPTKLDTIRDAPEPLRSALADNFASKEFGVRSLRDRQVVDVAEVVLSVQRFVQQLREQN